MGKSIKKFLRVLCASAIKTFRREKTETLVVLLLLLFLFLGLSSVYGQSFNRGVVLPTPITTNGRSFSIPFQVNPDESSDPPKSIELLVSSDFGGRWHSVERLPIDGKQFDFRAEKDGEYWFSFRTILLSGITRQSLQGQPQLRVLVDTVPPELSVQARQRTEGDVLVHWKTSDTNLRGKRPDFSVSSSQRTDEENWTSLEIDGRFLRASDTELEGNFLFWPENGLTQFRLRVGAVDLAGNRTEKIVPLEIKSVQRDALAISQEQDRRNPAIAAPDRPVEMLNLEGSSPSNAYRESSHPLSNEVPEGGAPVVGNSANNVPLTPPRPLKTTPKTQRKSIDTATSNGKNESSGAVALAPEYRPPPELRSATGQPLDLAPFSPDTSEKPLPAEPVESWEDKLISSMDRFFGGRLVEEIRQIEQEHVKKPSSEELAGPLHTGPAFPVTEPSLRRLPEIVPKNVTIVQGPVRPLSESENLAVAREPAYKLPEPPAASPAVPSRTVAENRAEERTEASPKTVASGAITGVSLNNSAGQAKVIVQWQSSKSQQALIDILRGDTITGPWLPIATNQPDSGEYWWYMTALDLKPFHLMIRYRSGSDVHTDITQSPIRINPKLLE